MNRHVKLTIVLILAGAVTGSSAQQRTTEPVAFQKVSERLYSIVGGRGAQGGAYLGDSSVLVIDSKMDKESVEQVIQGLRQLTDKPPKFLVNTHGDGDHMVGNRYFPDTMTIIAHENCRKDFLLPGRNGAPSEWTKSELLPFVPAVTFRDKMDLYLGSKRVELWHFGVGHTTGDAVVYFPEEKTAFVGDQIFLTRPQLIHSYKGGNSFEHVRTLTKMLQTLDAQRFCSGHSEMTDRQGVTNHIEQMQERQDKVKALVQQGKDLAQVKGAFNETEAALITSIYNEIKSGS